MPIVGSEHEINGQKVQINIEMESSPSSKTTYGTMNPEEGSLRPQLLDRFGLLVSVTAEKDFARRSRILRTVMDFDEAVFQLKAGQPAPFIEHGLKQDRDHQARLTEARKRMPSVKLTEKVASQCVALAAEFNVEGHRGDYLLAMAARALAALMDRKQVAPQHLRQVAPLALHHRRREFL